MKQKDQLQLFKYGHLLECRIWARGDEGMSSALANVCSCQTSASLYLSGFSFVLFTIGNKLSSVIMFLLSGTLMLSGVHSWSMRWSSAAWYVCGYLNMTCCNWLLCLCVYVCMCICICMYFQPLWRPLPLEMDSSVNAVLAGYVLNQSFTQLQQVSWGRCLWLWQGNPCPSSKKQWNTVFMLENVPFCCFRS